jgi:hypothetical protein
MADTDRTTSGFGWNKRFAAQPAGGGGFVYIPVWFGCTALALTYRGFYLLTCVVVFLSLSVPDPVLGYWDWLLGLANGYWLMANG